MTEFTGVGLHCAAESCNQQDFLPFTCDCCNGTYCLSHRSYTAHSCPSAGDKDFRAFVCPICRKTVRFVDSQDPNERWELHRSTDCINAVDSNGKKPQKQRCPAPGCREVLRPANKQRCAQCARETCLAHRFPDSHNCTGGGSWNGRRSSSGAAGAAAANRRGRVEATRPMSLREKAAQKRTATRSNGNTVKGTAERRRRQDASGVGREAAGVTAAGSGSGQGGEQCPLCGTRFGDVGSLVAHVEATHSERSRASAFGGGGGGGGGSGGEVCPVCNERFSDLALLVSHAEIAHPRTGGWGSYVGQASKACSIS